LLVTGIRQAEEQGDIRAAVAARLRLPVELISGVQVVRESLDARGRRPCRVLNLRVELESGEEALLRSPPPGVRRFTERDAQRAGLAGAWKVQRLRWPRALQPLVVGAGPAGIFAALRMAEAGAAPVLLERGEPVEERRSAVARFLSHGELDPESNVVFGEGGAGTFSDGKLYTRLRDGRVGYVLQRLVQAGADPSILSRAHPHLGTDRLRQVLLALRERLLSLGVTLRFSCRVVELLHDGQRCSGLRLADGERVRGHPIVLATGQAARDSVECYLAAGLRAELRPVAIGVRIEHPRRQIDQARHGAWASAHPAASYRLVAPRSQQGRQAYTFCMCPGGLVIPASERSGAVVVNGMSSSQRASRWSNAALVVPVGPADYGGLDVMAGFRFREAIEQRAWKLGGGEFRAPAQRVSDLLEGRASSSLPRTSHPLGVAPCDLRQLLPEAVVEAMIRAIRAFQEKIPGFGGEQAVLIAPETRTASPVRFLRDGHRRALGLEAVYPVGEGLGWGGGIVSAAVDGVKTAEAVIAAHAPEAVSASSP